MDFCLQTASRWQLNPEAKMLLICFKGMAACEVPARAPEGQRAGGFRTSAKQAAWPCGPPDNDCVCACTIQSETCPITTRCQERNVQATRPSCNCRLRAHFQIISDKLCRSVCNMKPATTQTRPRTWKPRRTANRATGLRTHSRAKGEAGRGRSQAAA